MIKQNEMKKQHLLLIIGFVLTISCTKKYYSALNGRWYGNANSWYIEFQGNNFTGETKGHSFHGTYSLKRKNIDFRFDNAPPEGHKVFYDYIERIKTYNVGKKQLRLYGIEFEIFMTR